MYKFLFFVFSITVSFVANSQSTQPSTDKTHTVLDAKSNSPVPYVTIYSHSSATGTVTNLLGQFKWNALLSTDSLTLSFVGYESQKFTFKNPIPDTIYLKPKTEILESAYVYGNMTFLYTLLSGCKKSKMERAKIAKTYFSLESIINTQTVEKMEAYYNGNFGGYDCLDLKLKTGRLAMTSFGNRFFISTETSKALYLHKLFGSGSHFPQSPIGLNKKKLAKLYTLKFEKSYLDESKHTIYQISYVPNFNCEDCFYGTVWVDSLQQQIQRITLFTDSTKSHPFIPIGHSDSLLNVSLEITKNYTTSSSIPQFVSTDFNYQLVYKTRTDSVFSVNTNALVYAFDYQNAFSLPHFDYGNIRYTDYILIGSLPYNYAFWKNYKEFKMANSEKDEKLFQSMNPAQTGTFVNTNNPYFTKPFFEHAYKAWSIKRIQLNQVLNDRVKGNVSLEAPPSQQYKLQTQIFFDVNEFNDSLHISSTSYFDPYYSYFYLPQTAKTDAFVNMYFDLTEIKRRELIATTQKSKTKKQVEALYQKSLTELELQHKMFIKETQRGNNLPAMIEWNEFINQRLRINNLEIFRLIKN